MKKNNVDQPSSSKVDRLSRKILAWTAGGPSIDYESDESSKFSLAEALSEEILALAESDSILGDFGNDDETDDQDQLIWNISAVNAGDSQHSRDLFRSQMSVASSQDDSCQADSQNDVEMGRSLGTSDYENFDGDDFSIIFEAASTSGETPVYVKSDDTIGDEVNETDLSSHQKPIPEEIISGEAIPEERICTIQEERISNITAVAAQQNETISKTDQSVSSSQDDVSDRDTKTDKREPATKDSEEKESEQMQRLRFRLYVTTCTLIVLIAASVSIGIGLLATSRNAGQEKTVLDLGEPPGDAYPTPPISRENSTDFEPASPSPTQPDSIAPSSSPTPMPTSPTFRVFRSRNELVAVLDMYLRGQNTSSSPLASIYGYPIGTWDVSLVDSFNGLFDGLERNQEARDFNEDISGWNTSSATDMSDMFRYAVSFNRDISSWDVAKVTNMTSMFNGASSFNQDINAWNVSNVQSMEYMFWEATSFDQDISSWDVSSVVSMRSMFRAAEAFNQDISTWDVSSVTIMDSMFRGAANFSQDLCEWGTRIADTASTWATFLGSSCPVTDKTNLTAEVAGPFCYSC